MNLATRKPTMVVSSTMPRVLKAGLISCVAVLAAAALCPAAQALERITLSNGFSIDCARHEQADEGHVRLIYASVEASATPNTQLLRANEIVSIDVLPDTPKPAPIVAASSAPVATADIPTLIARAGAERNIDIDLLYSVIHTESGFRTNAVSRAGARGLMQLMPKTARDLGVDDPFKPDQNIAGGAAYLDQLLTRYHDNVSLALAAYNAGPEAVDRYHGIPPFRETHAYVARVGREFKKRFEERKKREAEVAKQSALTPNEQATNEMPAAEPAKTTGASR